ncbi:MAG: Anti-sigma factor antagonist [uncultured bacterium]|nr:MAG: Anti-sigma factor antagonist [uncultured bacterium]
MQIEKKSESGIDILQLSGSLDLQHVAAFKQQVNIILKTGQNKIVFDLENLEFIDSAGLEAFLSSLVTAKKMGGAVALAGVRKAVARVFEITRMNKAFKIYPTLAGAIEDLAQ